MSSGIRSILEVKITTAAYRLLLAAAASAVVLNATGASSFGM